MKTARRIKKIVFLKDFANQLTMLNLICSLTGIYFAILGIYSASIIAMLWSLQFDWLDGLVARKLSKRSENNKLQGVYVDSLADMVGYGIFPAVFLITYSELNPWYLPVTFILIICCAIRFSSFILVKRDGDGILPGISSESIVYFITIIMLLDVAEQKQYVSVLLCLGVLSSSFLSLSNINAPKVTYRWYYGVTVFVVIMTTVYARRLLFPFP